MKNLLSLCLATVSANAQCTPDDTMTVPGLYPEPDSLPCIQQGVYQEFVIQFKNYTTYDVNGTIIDIDSITIDTIGNMPSGFCWRSNRYSLTTGNQSFPSGAKGCLAFAGKTYSDTGQYKLYIKVTAWIAGPTPIARTADQLGLRYDVRVVSSGNPHCPPIDTNKTSEVGVFAPIGYSPSGGCSGIGINETEKNFSGLSNYPNPFSGTTEVVFTSLEAKNYTFRVHNILGAEVHSEVVKTVPGKNTINYNAKNLESGVYFYSLSNGTSSVTGKMVVNK